MSASLDLETESELLEKTVHNNRCFALRSDWFWFSCWTSFTNCCLLIRPGVPRRLRIQQSKARKRLLDQSPIEKLSAPRYFALERNELNRYW